MQINEQYTVEEIKIAPEWKDSFPVDVTTVDDEEIREALEKINRYVEKILTGEIPEPLGLNEIGTNGKRAIPIHLRLFHYLLEKRIKEQDLDSFPPDLRYALMSNGLFGSVDTRIARNIADYIGDRSVLEVMGGSGWWAKALSEAGVNITCSDSFESHQVEMQVYPAYHADALDIVKNYGHDFDILFVSWPPNSENEIVKVCKAWGTKKPIIYIGETSGGCTACDEFFDHFFIEEIIKEYVPIFEAKDNCFVGRWKAKKRKEDYFEEFCRLYDIERLLSNYLDEGMSNDLQNTDTNCEPD